MGGIFVVSRKSRFFDRGFQIPLKLAVRLYIDLLSNLSGFGSWQLPNYHQRSRLIIILFRLIYAD